MPVDKLWLNLELKLMSGYDSGSFSRTRGQRQTETYQNESSLLEPLYIQSNNIIISGKKRIMYFRDPTSNIK